MSLTNTSFIGDSDRFHAKVCRNVHLRSKIIVGHHTGMDGHLMLLKPFIVDLGM